MVLVVWRGIPPLGGRLAGQKRFGRATRVGHHLLGVLSLDLNNHSTFVLGSMERCWHQLWLCSSAASVGLTSSKESWRCSVCSVLGTVGLLYMHVIFYFYLRKYCCF